MKQNLKIGCIIDETEKIPAWYFKTLSVIETETEHELYFIIRKKPGERKLPILYRLFQRFENRWFGSKNDATAPLYARAINNDIEFIHPEWKSEWLLSEEGLKTIKGYQLDLVYTIDYEEISEENVSGTTRYGLWYVRFGNELDKQKQPVAFWEVTHRHPVTGSSLLAKKKNELWLLYEGMTKTISFSVKHNFNSLAWKTSSFLAFRINELCFAGENFFPRFEKKSAALSRQSALPNLSIPYLFLKNGLAYTAHQLKQKFSSNRFTLLYAFQNFEPENIYSTQFKPVKLPEGIFYADPFILEKDGTQYIFFEEFVESKNKAHISVITVDKNHHISPSKTVLERPYHISYPFVFFHEGYYYMIPESSANKTVDLYRAKQFPYDWELVMNLFENETLIDATIHFENGKWWLFACSALHPFVSTNDQLFLYYNNDLFSNEWTSHPQNPIATRINNCRPAGRIFRYQNKLYRPAQNNAAQVYGYGLKINEIIVLNENEYQEKEVVSINPEQLGLKACHHVDFVEGLVVIDGVE